MQVRRLSSRGRCHWEGSVEIVLVFFGGVKKKKKTSFLVEFEGQNQEFLAA